MAIPPSKHFSTNSLKAPLDSSLTSVRYQALLMIAPSLIEMKTFESEPNSIYVTGSVRYQYLSKKSHSRLTMSAALRSQWSRWSLRKVWTLTLVELIIRRGNNQTITDLQGLNGGELHRSLLEALNHDPNMEALTASGVIGRHA